MCSAVLPLARCGVLPASEIPASIDAPAPSRTSIAAGLFFSVAKCRGVKPAAAQQSFLILPRAEMSTASYLDDDIHHR